MNHLRYKCIIFDFDGTLADTNQGIVKTFKETFKQLGQEIPSDAKITSTIGLALKDAFHFAFPEMSESECDSAAALYRSLFPTIAFPMIKAFDNVIPVLEEIKSRGIRLYIATSRSHCTLESLADQIGVGKFFEGMCAAEDVVNHKPAPDLVNLILDRTGLKPEDVLVVGDATFDLLMGQGAGCRVCGVSWGNQSRETLASVSPDYIIDDINELIGLL